MGQETCLQKPFPYVLRTYLFRVNPRCSLTPESPLESTPTASLTSFSSRYLMVGAPPDYSDFPHDYLLWIRVVPKSVSFPISLANSPHSTSSIYKIKEHLATTSSANEIRFPYWGKNNQGSFSSISGEGWGIHASQSSSHAFLLSIF